MASGVAARKRKDEPRKWSIPKLTNRVQRAGRPASERRSAHARTGRQGRPAARASPGLRRTCRPGSSGIGRSAARSRMPWPVALRLRGQSCGTGGRACAGRSRRSFGRAVRAVLGGHGRAVREGARPVLAVGGHGGAVLLLERHRAGLLVDNPVLERRQSFG